MKRTKKLRESILLAVTLGLFVLVSIVQSLRISNLQSQNFQLQSDMDEAKLNLESVRYVTNHNASVFYNYLLAVEAESAKKSF